MPPRAVWPMPIRSASAPLSTRSSKRLWIISPRRSTPASMRCSCSTAGPARSAPTSSANGWSRPMPPSSPACARPSRDADHRLSERCRGQARRLCRRDRRRCAGSRRDARSQMGRSPNFPKTCPCKAISTRSPSLPAAPRLDRAVDEIREALSGRPHIFNLGHGILPETPIENVGRLVARVRR